MPSAATPSASLLAEGDCERVISRFDQIALTQNGSDCRLPRGSLDGKSPARTGMSEPHKAKIARPLTITRSPTFHFVTLSPTATISPEPSEQGMTCKRPKSLHVLETADSGSSRPPWAAAGTFRSRRRNRGTVCVADMISASFEVSIANEYPR